MIQYPAKLLMNQFLYCIVTILWTLMSTLCNPSCQKFTKCFQYSWITVACIYACTRVHKYKYKHTQTPVLYSNKLSISLCKQIHTNYSLFPSHDICSCAVNTNIMAALYHYMPCQLHTKGKSTLTLVIIWGGEVRGSVKRKFLEQTWRTFLHWYMFCCYNFPFSFYISM